MKTLAEYYTEYVNNTVYNNFHTRIGVINYFQVRGMERQRARKLARIIWNMLMFYYVPQELIK